MAYKTIQKMLDAISYYNSVIEEIPENFDVHTDYLIDGITADNFVAGYKAYRNLIKTQNADMVASPESFGLITTDKKDNAKPANAMHYPYLWLFIALARSGEIKSGILYVNGAEFLAYSKGKKLSDRDTFPKNIESLMEKLPEYGFELTGYIYGEPADFTMEYKPNQYLLPVIRASVFTRCQEKSLVSDYACFNALMFKTPPNGKMDFADTHTAKLMQPQLVESVNAIITELATIGLSPSAERHHKHDIGWMKFGTCYQIYYREDRLDGIINIPDVRKNEKYLETLPEKYLNIIKETMFKGCKGCVKGECHARHAVELFGKKKTYCIHSYNMFYFPTELKDIPVIVDIIAHTYGKKRRCP